MTLIANPMIHRVTRMVRRKLAGTAIRWNGVRRLNPSCGGGSRLRIVGVTSQINISIICLCVKVRSYYISKNIIFAVLIDIYLTVPTHTCCDNCT